MGNKNEMCDPILIFIVNGVITYLSSFCVVQSSSSQFEISSFPPLEGIGLLHQYALFNDSLEAKKIIIQ